MSYLISFNPLSGVQQFGTYMAYGFYSIVGTYGKMLWPQDNKTIFLSICQCLSLCLSAYLQYRSLQISLYIYVITDSKLNFCDKQSQKHVVCDILRILIRIFFFQFFTKKFDLKDENSCNKYLEYNSYLECKLPI